MKTILADVLIVVGMLGVLVGVLMLNGRDWLIGAIIALVSVTLIILASGTKRSSSATAKERYRRDAPGASESSILYRKLTEHLDSQRQPTAQSLRSSTTPARRQLKLASDRYSYAAAAISLVVLLLFLSPYGGTKGWELLIGKASGRVCGAWGCVAPATSEETYDEGGTMYLCRYDMGPDTIPAYGGIPQMVFFFPASALAAFGNLMLLREALDAGKPAKKRQELLGLLAWTGLLANYVPWLGALVQWP